MATWVNSVSLKLGNNGRCSLETERDNLDKNNRTYAVER